MTNIMPPLTGTPLDYVPIGATVTKTKPTVFQRPIIKRSIIAAAAIGGATAALLFFPVATIAVVVMVGAVRGGDWAASRLNAYEDSNGKQP